MSHEFWYLSRAAGITAYLLLFASVAVGMASNMKLAGRTMPRVVSFELHRVVSLLALAFTLFHVYVLLGDEYFRFSIGELTVPFASPYRPWQTALGVFGLWTLVAVVASSYVRHLMSLRTWRAIHYLSFALYGIATFHGIASGADARAFWASAMYLGTGLVVLTLVFYRVQMTPPERAAGRLVRVAGAVATVLVASAAFASMLLAPAPARPQAAPADVADARPARFTEFRYDDGDDEYEDREDDEHDEHEEHEDEEEGEYGDDD